MNTNPTRLGFVAQKNLTDLVIDPTTLRRKYNISAMNHRDAPMEVKRIPIVVWGMKGLLTGSVARKMIPIIIERVPKKTRIPIIHFI